MPLKTLSLTRFHFSHLVREGRLKHTYATLSNLEAEVGTEIIVAQRSRGKNTLLPTMRQAKLVYASRLNPSDDANRYYCIILEDLGEVHDL